MFAYARYGQTRMNEAEFKQILRAAGLKITETIGNCFVDKAPMARGFFAGNDTFAILAFRGTEKDNSNDINADLDAIPVVEEPLGGRSAGLVHQGFLRYLKSVWPTVTELVHDYRAGHKTQEICITGHSLGAAIATLAFHHLQDGQMSLYTFGSPRVGNRAFCDSVSALCPGPCCYRAVDLEDIVTHIPFDKDVVAHIPSAKMILTHIPFVKERLYEHLDCPRVWIDPNHKVIQDPPALPSDIKGVVDLAIDFLRGKIVDPLPGPLADHSPVRYCNWLSSRPLQPPLKSL